MGDSLVLPWLCRVGFNAVPDPTRPNRFARDITPETRHAFNERVTAIATDLKVTRGRKPGTDGTVVETHIAYPSDSRLLGDGVQMLSRCLKRAQMTVQKPIQMAKETFCDRTRSARKQPRRIATHARRRSKRAKAGIKKAYQRRVKIARASVQQAQVVVDLLPVQSDQASASLLEHLEAFIPRVKQAVDQTAGRSPWKRACQPQRTS